MVDRGGVSPSMPLPERHHKIMKVDDIIPFFNLHFSNTSPIYCKAVVRSGVINIYTRHSKLTVLNRSAILCNKAFVASYCCFDLNFCRVSAGNTI